MLQCSLQCCREQTGEIVSEIQLLKVVAKAYSNVATGINFYHAQQFKDIQ